MLSICFVFVVIAFATAPKLFAQGIENGFDVPAGSEVAEASAIPANEVVKSKRLTDVIRNGGPLMIAIAVCSFVLVMFSFERLISLRKGRILPGPFVKRFLEQLRDGELNRDKAISLCEKNNSPIAQVFRAGVSKWGRPAVEVEQAILDAGERQSNHLRKYLRVINGVATISPLLGLLGTVLGMIYAFDAIANVDPNIADPKILIANGISSALLTTAAGMTVAIPALIAYLYFCSRVDRRVIEIDQLGMKVVDIISAEAIVESQTKTKRSRKAAA
jgi:biopolymer transport protein ExbB